MEDADLIAFGGPTHAFGMSPDATREVAHTKHQDADLVSQGGGIREWIDGLPRGLQI